MTEARIEYDNPQILSLITQVKKAAGALGKEKTAGLNFPFRGIDGTVNHLAKHVEDAGIVTVPETVNLEVVPREDAKGRIVKTTHITVRYRFYAPDGSYVDATTSGTADDFADRSTTQAQSVAFRIALLQVFFLPTQSPEPEQTGQNVQDGAVTPAQRKLDQARKAAPAKPAGGTARDKVRVEWIESGKVDKDDVNALVTQVKQESPDLKGDAVFQEVLNRLGKGEVG